MSIDEGALRELCKSLGVNLRSWSVEPHEDSRTAIVAMPPMFARVTIDGEMIASGGGAELVLKEFDRAARLVFALAAKHLAAHDRSPYERVEQMEAAATKLIELVHKLSERMLFAEANPLAIAAHELAELVRSKPGAVSWRREHDRSGMAR